MARHRDTERRDASYSGSYLQRRSVHRIAALVGRVRDRKLNHGTDSDFQPNRSSRSYGIFSSRHCDASQTSEMGLISLIKLLELPRDLGHLAN